MKYLIILMAFMSGGVNAEVDLPSDQEIIENLDLLANMELLEEDITLSELERVKESDEVNTSSNKGTKK